MTVPKYVPNLALTGTSTAVTFHFRPEGERNGFGWALCTVNDRTGELAIQSDWGCWSHRWSADPRSLGHPTLGERADRHYLADKLTTRADRRCFDQGKTVAAFRKMLCERRFEAGHLRNPRLTREVARDLWVALGELDADDATLFCERFMQVDSYELLDAEPWDSLEYEPTTGYMVLLHGILPALVEACRAQVQERAA